MAKLHFRCIQAPKCRWIGADLASLVRHWQDHQAIRRVLLTTDVAPLRQTHRTILLTDLGAEYLAGSGRSMKPTPADPSIGGANA